MLVATIGMAAGLALLVTAADWFVLGAVRVAARLRFPTVAIGALVIGFGTSAPEMVVSGMSARADSVDIAIGNIVGSNVANLSLVLGAAALVTTVTIAGSTVRRELSVALAATGAVALAIQNGLTRSEGIVLLLGLVVFILATLRSGSSDTVMDEDVEEFLSDDPIQLGREVARTVVGLIGTIGAAHLVVEATTTIANDLGIEEGFVGLTIIAIGTSLPELATALQAARKNETDLILGNLLGSNIFNSLGVSGIAAVVGGSQMIDPGLSGPAVGIMLAVSMGAALAMYTGRRVVRQEGALLLVAWLAMLPIVA